MFLFILTESNCDRNLKSLHSNPPTLFKTLKEAENSLKSRGEELEKFGYSVFEVQHNDDGVIVWEKMWNNKCRDCRMLRITGDNI